jgi:hypothetical protein
VLSAVTTPIFAPPDEASHAGYILEVAEGRLPTILTPIPSEGVPGMQRALQRRDGAHKTIWTANHPPLYYALTALPAKLALDVIPGEGGLKAVRLLSVLFGAIAVMLVAALAAQLVPGRPALPVAASLLAATVPAFTHYSGILYNDSLGVLTATAALLAAVVTLRKGPSWPRLAMVAASASAAALTRSSGLVVAAVACLAVLIACWRSVPVTAGLRRRALAASGHATLVGITVAVTSGWFWLRNVRLYGDLTGSAFLLDRFKRAPDGSVLSMLLNDRFWSLQAQRFLDFSYFNYAGGAMENSTVAWARWLLLIPLAGAAAIVARRVRHRLVPDVRRPDPGDLRLAGLGRPAGADRGLRGPVRVGGREHPRPLHHAGARAHRRRRSARAGVAARRTAGDPAGRAGRRPARGERGRPQPVRVLGGGHPPRRSRPDQHAGRGRAARADRARRGRAGHRRAARRPGGRAVAAGPAPQRVRAAAGTRAAPRCPGGAPRLITA